MDKFFEEENCAFLKIKYIPEDDNLQFKTQTFISEKSQGTTVMAALVRGCLEALLRNPGAVYTMGLQAQENDFEDSLKDIPEDQRKLLKDAPRGLA